MAFSYDVSSHAGYVQETHVRECFPGNAQPLYLHNNRPNLPTHEADGYLPFCGSPCYEMSPWQGSWQGSFGTSGYRTASPLHLLDPSDSLMSNTTPRCPVFYGRPQQEVSDYSASKHPEQFHQQHGLFVKNDSSSCEENYGNVCVDQGLSVGSHRQHGHGSKSHPEQLNQPSRPEDAVFDNVSDVQEQGYSGVTSLIERSFLFRTHDSSFPGRSLRRTSISHDAMQHAQENRCHICEKTFARHTTFLSHLRVHSKERPYHCKTCGKNFTQANILVSHIRTHSGERPFRCTMCDRCFSQRSSLVSHRRTHTGDRPYQCDICQNKFADSSTLTKHRRVHTGEKPYACKVCNWRFSQSGNLKRHMKLHI